MRPGVSSARPERREQGAEGWERRLGRQTGLAPAGLGGCGEDSGVCPENRECWDAAGMFCQEANDTLVSMPLKQLNCCPFISRKPELKWIRIGGC